MIKKLPDSKGYFGVFGGKYVPETLMKALSELEHAYKIFKRDKKMQNQLADYLHSYAGRPTPLYEAKRLTKHFGRARIFLKREDLTHTGSHKINNTLAQALLAKMIGKNRIIAETGAGQHGVATATAACVFGLRCVVYMGNLDVQRQALNVYKMKLLNTNVVPVFSGSETLKDAINEAIRDWVTNVETTHYLIGSVMGPHPYPMMVRDFQSIIGRETRRIFSQRERRLPDYLIACVGGGSNAMGFFHPFLCDKRVRLYGVEAAGEGLHSQHHAATLEKGAPGVLHGMKSYLLQDHDGQVQLAHSISAGLDYPGVGPEHAYLKESERATYVSVTDREAIEGFQMLSELEGIMPALEPSHALGYLKYLMPRTKKDETVILCLSGRGDKDIDTVRKFLDGNHAQ